MTRARWGTLFAGLAGIGLLLAAGIQLVVMLPVALSGVHQPLTNPANYLALIADKSLPFFLMNLALLVSLLALALLVFHLLPEAEPALSALAEQAPLPWLLLPGIAGALLGAGVYGWLGFQLPGLARLAASGSATALADWEARLGFWGQWGPAGAYLLLSGWLFWQAGQWPAWRRQLSRAAALLSLLLGVLPLLLRPSGGELVLFAFGWLVMGSWCLTVAHWFWQRELAAFYAEV